MLHAHDRMTSTPISTHTQIIVPRITTYIEQYYSFHPSSRISPGYIQYSCRSPNFAQKFHIIRNIHHIEKGLIARITTLGLPNDAIGRGLLERAANLVLPIMEANNWRIVHLKEFLPRSQSLLGLNRNQGVVVEVRLRRGDKEANTYA